MSNTPNPRRKPLEKTTRVVQMYPIWRDGKGNVLIPHGSLPREAYEAARAANPQVTLPEYLQIPLLEKAVEV